jgi:hypothetical protein
MKSKLKAPGTERLKLKCDNLLSRFAFNFNLRCYIVATSCASSLLTGVLHARIAWDVLSQCPAGELKSVLSAAGVPGGGTGVGGVKSSSWGGTRTSCTGYCRGWWRRRACASGGGLHLFQFPLNLSLLSPFPINLRLLCPPHDQK